MGTVRGNAGMFAYLFPEVPISPASFPHSHAPCGCFRYPKPLTINRQRLHPNGKNIFLIGRNPVLLIRFPCLFFEIENDQIAIAKPLCLQVIG